MERHQTIVPVVVRDYVPQGVRVGAKTVVPVARTDVKVDVKGGARVVAQLSVHQVAVKVARVGARLDVLMVVQPSVPHNV